MASVLPWGFHPQSLKGQDRGFHKEVDDQGTRLLSEVTVPGV